MQEESTHPNSTQTISAAEADPNACRFCGSYVASDHIFCSDCGFAHNGTLQQKKAFQAKLKGMSKQYKVSKRKALQAKNALAFLAVLFGIIATLIFIFSILPVMKIVAAWYAALTVIFSGLYGWAHFRRKELFPAVLSGFILYTSLQIYYTIIDPLGSIDIFLPVRIIIIATLLIGARNSYRAQQLGKFMEKNPKLKAYLEKNG